MSTLPNPSTQPEQDVEPGAAAGSPDYPKTWLWGEHGDVCSGTFVRFDKAATREYGKKLILILEVDGRERSIWLLQTAISPSYLDRPTSSAGQPAGSGTSLESVVGLEGCRPRPTPGHGRRCSRHDPTSP
jgi:hypothetical protein